MCLLIFCMKCCKAWTRSIHSWAYAHKHVLCRGGASGLGGLFVSIFTLVQFSRPPVCSGDELEPELRPVIG